MRSMNKRFIDFLTALEKTVNDVSKSYLINEGPSYQGYKLFLSSLTKENVNKQVNYLARLVRPIDKKNVKKILEVGSGYGLNLIVLKYLGFEDVTGVEIVKSMSDNANLLIQTAQKYFDFDLIKCKSIQMDAECTNFPDNEFDAIFAIEMISHVPSIDRFLREVNRILKFNSKLIISDGNNCACPWYYKKRKAIWKKIREEELEKRIKFIKDNFPAINPNLRASIAIHTELMSKEDMYSVIPQIVKSNKLPMSLYFEGYAPVFFETGIWDEYGFFPRKFVKDLAKYGFNSNIEIYLGSARGFPYEHLETIINQLPLALREKLKPNFFCYSKKIKTADYLI